MVKIYSKKRLFWIATPLLRDFYFPEDHSHFYSQLYSRKRPFSISTPLSVFSAIPFTYSSPAFRLSVFSISYSKDICIVVCPYSLVFYLFLYVLYSVL